MRRWSVWAASVGACAATACGGGAAGPGERPVVISVAPAPLDPANPANNQAGQLSYCGGWELSSDDAGWGGFSGLELNSPKLLGPTRLVAVTDQGDRLDFTVTFEPPFDQDRLNLSVASAQFSALLGEDGKPFAAKVHADAEGLALMGDRLMVSFERNHRILDYSAGSKNALPRPLAALDAQGIDPNKGWEGLTAYQGALLAGLEAAETAPNGEPAYPVWRIEEGEDGAWRSAKAFHIAAEDGFGLTGMATLPHDQGVVVLLRSYEPGRGNEAIIRRIAAHELEQTDPTPPASPLEGEEWARLGFDLTTDNFEALAVQPMPMVRENSDTVAQQNVRLWLMSDDNFNERQRTLLMCFSAWLDVPMKG